MTAKSGWRAAKRVANEAAHAINKPLPGVFFPEDWLGLIIIGWLVYLVFFRG